MVVGQTLAAKLKKVKVPKRSEKEGIIGEFTSFNANCSKGAFNALKGQHVEEACSGLCSKLGHCIN